MKRPLYILAFLVCTCVAADALDSPSDTSPGVFIAQFERRIGIRP